MARKSKEIALSTRLRAKELKKLLKKVPDDAFISLYVDGCDAQDWLAESVVISNGKAVKGTDGYFPYFASVDASQEGEDGKDVCIMFTV